MFGDCIELPGNVNLSAFLETRIVDSFTDNGEALYNAPVEIPLKRTPQEKEMVTHTGEHWEKTTNTIYWLMLSITQTADLGDKINGCAIVQDFGKDKFAVS